MKKAPDLLNEAPDLLNEAPDLLNEAVALRTATGWVHKFWSEAATTLTRMCMPPFRDSHTMRLTAVKLDQKLYTTADLFNKDLIQFSKRFPNTLVSIIIDVRKAIGKVAGSAGANCNYCIENDLTKDNISYFTEEHNRLVGDMAEGSPKILELLSKTQDLIVVATIEAAKITVAPAAIAAAESSSIPAAIAAAESSSISISAGLWSSFSGWASADPVGAGLIIFAAVAITAVTVKLVYGWYTAPVTDLPLTTKSVVDDLSSSVVDNLPVKAGFDPFEGCVSEGVFGPFGLPLLILFAGVIHGSIASPNLCKLYALDAIPLTKAFRVICQFFKFSFKKN